MNIFKFCLYIITSFCCFHQQINARRNISSSKVSKLECFYDPKYCGDNKCELKALNRTTKRVSMYCGLLAPIHDVMVILLNIP